MTTTRRDALKAIPRTEETKEKFMERYQSSSSIPDLFEKWMIALPCDCEDGGGPTHWAAISRSDPMLIEDHLEFHAPPNTPWPDEIPRPEKADAS